MAERDYYLGHLLNTDSVCKIVLLFKFCSPIGVSISLASDDGLISTREGELHFNPVSFSGFSYGVVYVRISTLTYSEFAARGFNIEDEFAPDLIPAMSADGMLSLSRFTPLFLMIPLR